MNLADLLLRHSSANHKRETIPFSKRRQGALGLTQRRLGVGEILGSRLFPDRVARSSMMRSDSAPIVRSHGPKKGQPEGIVASVNRFTVAGRPNRDIPVIGEAIQKERGWPMTARTADQIRLILFMAMIIAIAVAIGVGPTVCRSL